LIDARNLGVIVDRTHRELTDDHIARISAAYHAWRGERGTDKYVDIPGFCASARLQQIAEQGYVLTPGRYVDAKEAEEDDELLGEKITRLTNELYQAFDEGRRLQDRVRNELERVSAS
jgi:type I restriction enzyme M protein